jgi:hypothetical protein
MDALKRLELVEAEYDLVLLQLSLQLVSLSEELSEVCDLLVQKADLPEVKQFFERKEQVKQELIEYGTFESVKELGFELKGW